MGQVSPPLDRYAATVAKGCARQDFSLPCA